MHAIAYIRAGTEDQDEAGIGLEAQAVAVVQWAAGAGVEIDTWFQDVIDGSIPVVLRPGLMNALAALDTGDVLVVARRDRLAADLVTVGMLEAAARSREARLVSAAGEGDVSIDTTAVPVRWVVDACAEYEQLLGSLRTKAALAAKTRKGERIGQIPYGKALAPDGVHLVDQPAERRAVDRIEALRRDGRKFAQIAATLDAEGFRTKSGRPWSISSVFRLAQGASTPDNNGSATVPAPHTDSSR